MSKKINWAGLAAFIVALTAVPGVLINTYLDYSDRNTSELVQKSSHKNVSDAIEVLGEDVDECFEDINNLEREISELHGFIKGRFGRAYEKSLEQSAPVSKPSPNISSKKMKPSNKFRKNRIPASIEDIVQYVQDTGEIFQTQDQEQVN